MISKLGNSFRGLSWARLPDDDLIVPRDGRLVA